MFTRSHAEPGFTGIFPALEPMQAAGLDSPSIAPQLSTGARVDPQVLGYEKLNSRFESRPEI